MGIGADSPTRCLDELYEILPTTLSELSKKTGWAFTLLAGGPCPEKKGEIVTRSFHSQVNYQGYSFRKAHPNFAEAYVEPFTAFLHQVYSKQAHVQLSPNAYSA